MSEELKVKYRKCCKDPKQFYKMMEEWDVFLLTNPNLKTEEKLEKLEKIRKVEPDLYQVMKEDIENGFIEVI